MKTLKIGSQEWATQDLKVTKFRNGEDIPLVEDNGEWVELDSAAYCITPNGSYLYNWYAVNDPRGLAPEGFHVPTDEEWTELTDFLGGSSVAGAKMKSSSSDTPPWSGTNSCGFSALPGGFRFNFDGFFYNGGYFGYWWSSSAYGAYSAWYRYLNSDDDDVIRLNNYQRNGFSVRCLKNFNTNEK
jgi:uncharacterized protein (TIGR02145 family)